MICEKKVSFYVSKCVTNDYLNPHLKASDRLSEHKIIAHDKQVKGKLFSTITNKRFSVVHTVMNLSLYRHTCWVNLKHETQSVSGPGDN